MMLNRTKIYIKENKSTIIFSFLLKMEILSIEKGNLNSGAWGIQDRGEEGG